MVMRAKLERRQRRQLEKSSKANEESTYSSMLGDSIDDDITTAGHPQSIPPPSEPVLPAGTKMSSPKPANGATTSSHERAYVANEAVRPEHNIRSQSPPRGFAEDKSEARHSNATVQKGKLMTTFTVSSIWV